MSKLPLVKLVNIHKWFGRVCALEGVDLSVDYNEIVGLLGDNGAGKSTLIEILAGSVIPDSGKIELFYNHEDNIFESLSPPFLSKDDVGSSNIKILTSSEKALVIQTIFFSAGLNSSINLLG